jgi:hypothetical protein
MGPRLVFSVAPRRGKASVAIDQGDQNGGQSSQPTMASRRSRRFQVMPHHPALAPQLSQKLRVAYVGPNGSHQAATAMAIRLR